jgi:hypothetical protein
MKQRIGNTAHNLSKFRSTTTSAANVEELITE